MTFMSAVGGPIKINCDIRLKMVSLTAHDLSRPSERTAATKMPETQITNSKRFCSDSLYLSNNDIFKQKSFTQEKICCYTIQTR